MPRAVTATYRLQLTREFPLGAARELVPYLERLGVSHLYLSPVLAARPNSRHGYDVTDPTRINPELGGEDTLRALAQDLHARDMGIVLDVVPNHMAASAENSYWDDVLARGDESRWAGWFDIDWAAPGADGKVVLPVLGDELEKVIERGELQIRTGERGARIHYFDKSWPVAGDASQDIRAVLDRQHYSLRHWRVTERELNYRRFFDVSDLVGLRMDHDAIFDATHALVLALVRDGVIDGLRVDHVDGLRSPGWYLSRLRAAVDAARQKDAPSRLPIYVEKILSADESLPREWPVDGTTGYDFMNEVEDLFVDPLGFSALEANYRGLRHSPTLTFRGAARDGKRRALTTSLAPDVQRVARIASAWSGIETELLAKAIVELIVNLDVYRTYIEEPGVGSDADFATLASALRAARLADGVSGEALDALERAFTGAPDGNVARADLVARLQQLSGPAMAKGVEDTALYVYVPLASRNEVGGSPERPLADARARAHARNVARARDWPRTMLATNTHDTKRSADLRARLDALASVPDEWARHVARWRKLNRQRKRTVRGKPSPDPNLEHLYYQTLAGLWPAQRRDRRTDDLPDGAWLEDAARRLAAYMLKAARESKTRTSWTEADPQFEKAVTAFVSETMTPSADAPFLGDVARLVASISDEGFANALARVAIHCTAPGVPDLYQGDEVWNFTLVDPDNRRPVDWDRRRRILDASETPRILRDAFAEPGALMDDTVKIALTERLLRFRRDNAKLFLDGEYLPLLMAEDVARHAHLFAFARRSENRATITVARVGGVERGETDALPLPNDLEGRWTSVFTGRVVEFQRVGPQLTVPPAALIPQQPCELLLRVE